MPPFAGITFLLLPTHPTSSFFFFFSAFAAMIFCAPTYHPHWVHSPAGELMFSRAGCFIISFCASAVANTESVEWSLCFPVIDL